MFRPVLTLMPFFFGLLSCASVSGEPRRVESVTQSSQASADDETVVVTGSRLSNPASGVTPLIVIDIWPAIDLNMVEDWEGRTIRRGDSRLDGGSKDILAIRNATRSFRLCRGRYETSELVINSVSNLCPQRGKGRVFARSIFSTDGERAIIVWQEMTFRKLPKKRSIGTIHGPCYITLHYVVYDTVGEKPVRLSTGRETTGPHCLS